MTGCPDDFGAELRRHLDAQVAAARADERAKVADEIAEAIEVLTLAPVVAVLTGAYRHAALIARAHRQSMEVRP